MTTHRFRYFTQLKQLVVFWLALVMPLMGGCAGLYSPKAIEGTVIDAETKAPIEGAIIVAQWRLWPNAVGYDKELLHVYETITDKAGRYHIPAWGPVALPARANFSQGKDPLLLVFKSSYMPASFKNPFTGLQNPLTEDTTGRRPPVGEFIWHGKALPLTRKIEDSEKYIFAMWSWEGSLPSSIPEMKYEIWRSYPRTIYALDIEHKRLRAKGLSGIGSIPVDKLSPEDQQYIRSKVDEK